MPLLEELKRTFEFSCGAFMQACVNEGTFQPIFWVDGLRSYIVCINSPVYQILTMRSL
jgi:hypothetical protein